MDIKTVLNPSVNGRNSNEQAKSVSGEAAPVNSPGVEESAKNADKVTLTSAQGQLRELEQKAQDINIDQNERIQQLRAAINDGSYQVDAEKVADKLMQTEALFNRS